MKEGDIVTCDGLVGTLIQMGNGDAWVLLAGGEIVVCSSKAVYQAKG